MDSFISFESGSSDQWDLQAIVRQCSSCPDSIMISTKPSSDYACFDQPLLIRHENEAFEALKTGNNGRVDDDCGKGRGRLQKQNSEGGAKERRRKCKQKTSFVQQFAGDRALSDHWNWRKYGQKSIKGSPYPRSYYKCSSSGDCLARKQVEHSRSDPGTFLITYINEHNHPYPTRRHSQAGRTKERFDTTTTSSNKVASTIESSSNYTWTASSSDLETPSFGHNHDHDDHDRGLGLKCIKDDHEFGIGQEEDGAVVGRCGGEDSVDVLDMVLDDEFFAGLEYLEGLEMDLLFP